MSNKMKETETVRIFEMVNGISLPVDYSLRGVPRNKIGHVAHPVEDWAVTHHIEFPTDGITEVSFSFMKVMKLEPYWDEAPLIAGSIGFRALVTPEMEALRAAEARRFNKVFGMVNSCERVRKLFPNGSGAFILTGLNSSITSKKGLRLHPSFQVEDGDGGDRSIHMLPARGDYYIPPLTVIPLVRLS